MDINKATKRLLSNRPLLTDLLILLSLTPKPPFLPRNPDQKDNARQRNREGEKVPPFIRDLELLIASIIFLKVEECHAKYSLSRCVSKVGRNVGDIGTGVGVRTEMKVPGRKNMVTAAIVIMDELSRCASLAIVAVSVAIWRFVSLSTWVERWKAWRH